jgi:hypothetical protein
VLAVLVERFANWSLPLYVMAVLYAFSSVCWLFVDPCPGRAVAVTVLPEPPVSSVAP